jgi:cyclopropane-fatty-acyl-phospholipid synthase
MSAAAREVVQFYDEAADLSPLFEVTDYTECMYLGDPNTPYEIGQQNQADWIVKQFNAEAGDEILDVGCGLGRLVRTAGRKGLRATGITISPQQVEAGRVQGLDVQLCNYRTPPADWRGRFKAVVANGSLEHFARPWQTMDERSLVYREMFAVFHWLMQPDGRLITTAIHFAGKAIDPPRATQNPFLQIWDREAFHFSILAQGYRGTYPIYGQLAECAQQYFRLVEEVDGTEDYRLTSEEWCRRFKRALWRNSAFQKRLARALWKHPWQSLLGAMSLVGPESWAWQFRGPNPPMSLYRQVWQRI